MQRYKNLNSSESIMTGKTLVVRSNIREYDKVNDTSLFVANDFGDRLQEKVIKLIHDACKRAKENQRNTVMGRDL